MIYFSCKYFYYVIFVVYEICKIMLVQSLNNIPSRDNAMCCNRKIISENNPTADELLISCVGVNLFGVN